MFTIDLLKGQGIPAKSRPEGIAAAVITIAVPVVAAAIMFGCFFVNKVRISFGKNEIARLEKKFEESDLNEAIKKHKTLEQEVQHLSAGLSEVAGVINGQAQWSPVLEAVIKNMPYTIVLKAADVKKDSKKIKKPKADGDEKGVMIEETVPIRILHLSLTTNQQNNFDQAVKGFRESLFADPAVGPKLDDIRVAQEFDKVEGKGVISYEMYLVFKPSL